MTAVDTRPSYQLLPDLTPDEYESLREDIAASGVRVPIDVDESGAILDGHHRARIAEELGIECPRRTVAGLTDDQKRSHALSVNVHRRNLTREQRRELVLRLRQEGMTQQAIADAISVPRTTVQHDLEQLDETVKLPDVITGADGKQRPATYVSTTTTTEESVLVDPETGEIAPAPRPVPARRQKPRTPAAEYLLQQVLTKTQAAATSAAELSREQIDRIKPNAAPFVGGIREGVEALQRLLNQLTEESS